MKEVIELDQNRFTLGRTSVFSCELARGEDGDGNHELLNFIIIFRTFAGKIGVSPYPPPQTSSGTLGTAQNPR
jgi:hypothetical protein